MASWVGFPALIGYAGFSLHIRSINPERATILEPPNEIFSPLGCGTGVSCAAERTPPCSDTASEWNFLFQRQQITEPLFVLGRRSGSIGIRQQRAIWCHYCAAVKLLKHSLLDLFVLAGGRPPDHAFGPPEAEPIHTCPPEPVRGLCGADCPGTHRHSDTRPARNCRGSGQTSGAC